jgi:hypothetical protein
VGFLVFDLCKRSSVDHKVSETEAIIQGFRHRKLGGSSVGFRAIALESNAKK